MDENLDRSLSKQAYPDEKPLDAENGHHRRASVQILHDLIAEGSRSWYLVLKLL